MILTFLSGLLGIVSPFAFKTGEELLKMKMQKEQHKQEMEMLKLTSQISTREADIHAHAQAEVARQETNKVKVQMGNQVTPYAVVEILRGTLRPIVTYLFVLGSLAMIAMTLYNEIQSGTSWSVLMNNPAMSFLFGTCTTIITFWFSDRAVNRKK